MAGLLRKIVNTLHTEVQPVQDVSTLLKPLTRVDAKWVWDDGLWALEHVVAAEGSRLTARDTTLLATVNAAARLHPYTSPRRVPGLPKCDPSIPPASGRPHQPPARNAAPLVLPEYRTPVNVPARPDGET